MAQRAPSFQDSGTADVILDLLSDTDQSLTLPLHSQVLRRSQFFEARLSERWNPDDLRPLQLTLPDRKNTAACIRCIELMYAPSVKPTFFTTVQDALEVLQVAAEFLFNDCINACLCFLEGVPWSTEEETAIKPCLASLSVEIPVDLAARLRMSPGCNSVEIMKDRLRAMVPYISSANTKASNKIGSYMEKQLQENVHPSVSSDFASVNEQVLYGEWNRILESPTDKASGTHLGALNWLFQRLLSLKIGGDAVRILAQENTALQLLRWFPYSPIWMLMCTMRAFLNKELILSRSIRLALVKTWLPIIGRRKAVGSGLEDSLQEGMRALTKTLPPEDHSEIFNIWFETCFDERWDSTGPIKDVPWPDLQEVFEVSCGKLRQAPHG